MGLVVQLTSFVESFRVGDNHDVRCSSGKLKAKLDDQLDTRVGLAVAVNGYDEFTGSGGT